MVEEGETVRGAGTSCKRRGGGKRERERRGGGEEEREREREEGGEEEREIAGHHTRTGTGCDH